MSEPRLAVVATLFAQSAGAAVIALLLFGFVRQYRNSYLIHWTLGWTAVAIAHVAATAANFVDSSRIRLALAAVAGVAGFLQIAWLLFGAYELVRRRPVRLLTEQWTLIGLAAAGLIAGLLPRGGTITSLVAAFAYSYAAVKLWQARTRRTGAGFATLSAAFALYGLERAHSAALAIFTAITGAVPEYALYLGFIDYVLQMMMGMGMVACLLEDEREASELATVEIEHLAYHDALTGLPNRPLFIDRLIVAIAQSGRGNQKLAVFFLDLDRFKDINDSLGHSIGDTLLKAVAERVRRCVREGDTVARFGGDEFTLLVPRIETVDDAAKVAQKIIETLKIPFSIAERELFVTTSIGVSLYPSDGLDAETLVRNADTAMYRAKEQGRDNYQLYAPAMNAQALERLALENMLRKAVSQDELVVYYQPIVDVSSRSIIGVEALVRWNHPQLGLLSPAHFISVAELSGLIVPIGNWVLRTACRQAKGWHKRIDHELTVSVNLSARQFQHHELVDEVSRILRETGLPANCLELEITESNAMQNSENTIHILRELKSIGVRIAMDDFGTGYSSLNYLKRFPIDTLKLDQSFVREINVDRIDAAIVSAVISMAHSLDLVVVAEGVETEAQLEALQKQRCDRIQGYLYSVPLSADELEPYLIDQKALTG